MTDTPKTTLRNLTADEARVMDKALRASVKIVPDPRTENWKAQVMTDRSETTREVEEGGWYVARDAERDRPGLMPRFDEIVTGPIDSVHIEQLSEGLYWMALYKGGERLVVTFSSLSGRASIAGRFEIE